MAALCLMSLALIFGADLYSPRDVTVGALSVLPVAVAAALLSPRLVVAIVIAGLATRVAAVAVGEVNAVSAVAEMSTMVVIAVVGHDAAVNFALAEQGALQDALTGLPNRRLFMDRFENALRRADRDKASVCLLILDLDGFKTVNDSLGHQGGDRVLQLVSQALLAELRESDTLARLGGDEFGVLLPDVDAAPEGVATAERLSRIMSDALLVRGRRVHVHGSIGVAAYPQCGGDAAALIRSADEAMYEAKRSDRPYEVGRRVGSPPPV